MVRCVSVWWCVFCASEIFTTTTPTANFSDMTTLHSEGLSFSYRQNRTVFNFANASFRCISNTTTLRNKNLMFYQCSVNFILYAQSGDGKGFWMANFSRLNSPNRNREPISQFFIHKTLHWTYPITQNLRYIAIERTSNFCCGELLYWRFTRKTRWQNWKKWIEFCRQDSVILPEFMNELPYQKNLDLVLLYRTKVRGSHDSWRLKLNFEMYHKVQIMISIAYYISIQALHRKQQSAF